MHFRPVVPASGLHDDAHVSGRKEPPGFAFAGGGVIGHEVAQLLFVLWPQLLLDDAIHEHAAELVLWRRNPKVIAALARGKDLRPFVKRAARQ